MTWVEDRDLGAEPILWIGSKIRQHGKVASLDLDVCLEVDFPWDENRAGLAKVMHD